jgi:chemotaxis protein methyltransferase CheR
MRKIVYPMYHNLTKEAPFYGIDVIFCRNVLIYFSVPTIRRIAGYLHTALNDNGFLFLGHSESLYGITDRFRLVDFAGLLLYRKRLKIAGT